MTPDPTVHRPSIAGPGAGAEIDAFAESLARFQAGRVPEAVFLERRLRHGVYGQKQDGVHMMRSKLPLGLLSPDQLEAFADISETHGHGVAHLTTRQNIQVHFVPLSQTVDLMRVLDRARMTAREACGNVVRNICASPLSGLLPDSAFDVTPYGFALARFLLRHPEGQSLGRKFKVHLTDSPDPRFDLTRVHDTGLRAVVREEGGVQRRGFEVRVGGGLGAVPYEAALVEEFLPEEELLPFHAALLRVFARYGKKRNRARARLKFLVAKRGLPWLREALAEARAALPHDPAWADFRVPQAEVRDNPLHPPGGALPAPRTAEQARFLDGNVVAQAQPGRVAVQVRVPRGDLSPAQLRGLAALLRDEVGDTLRIGVDQSLWLRSVSTDRLWAVHARLQALELGGANAGGLGDTVTCPGADTCKLGITSPRALARQMQARLDRLAEDPRLGRIRVHVSGCPNSCSQHQVADIGLFGAARTRDGVTAPHFVLLLGGRQAGAGDEGPGSGFATSIIKLPAARVGEAIERLGRLYLAEAEGEEPFGRFARRLGRARVRSALADLADLPSPEEAPALYREHGQAAAPFVVRRGRGECAGEVVDQADLLLSDADAAADRTLALRDEGAPDAAIAAASWQAFELAARALLATDGIAAPVDVVADFDRHFVGPGRIFDGVAQYLGIAATEPAPTGDRLRRRVEEAGLFVEEAHSIIGRLRNPAAAR